MTFIGDSSWTLSFGTAGDITDNGNQLSLTLSASNGTLILSGSNNYSGGTNVTAGTLIVTNANAIEDGSSLTVGAAIAFAPVVPSVAASSLAAAPVPEPGTLALLAAAVCGAAVYQRLRLRQKKQWPRRACRGHAFALTVQT